jgi:hypothetical protein
MSTQADRDRLVEYLLGDPSEDHRREIEQQYFKDDDAYEAVLAVENELAYDYAAGGLSPVQRQRFEQRLLGTPEQRARVETARALLRRVQPAGVRAWWPLAAAAVLVLALAGWLAADLARQSDDSERASVAAPPVVAPEAGVVPKGEPAKTPAQPPPLAGRPPGLPAVIAVTLRPGLVRSTDTGTRIVIPADAGVVRVTLEMPSTATESNRSYRIAIRNAEGAEVWSGAPLRPVLPLVIEVPPRAVVTGDYERVLSGATGTSTSEDLAEYYFSVVRR